MERKISEFNGKVASQPASSPPAMTNGRELRYRVGLFIFFHPPCSSSFTLSAREELLPFSSLSLEVNKLSSYSWWSDQVTTPSLLSPLSPPAQTSEFKLKVKCRGRTRGAETTERRDIGEIDLLSLSL